jgi:hypothetical protein
VGTPDNDMLARSIEYLEANLALLRRRPELHAYQIAAFERYLAMARSSSSGAEYAARVKADGDMFEVNRALVLDRYADSVRIHRAMGDDRALRAAFTVLRAAREATGHADLDTRVTAAIEQAAPLDQAARITTGQIRGLFIDLLDWGTQANPSRKAGHLSMVRHAWGQITAHDPDCTFDKLCTYPPYRRRIPFTDARLASLRQWFEEAMS